MHDNRCTVVLEGLFPGILLHNPAGMSVAKSAKKSIPTAEEEAEASAYWTEDHTSLAFPAMNMRSGLVQASAGWKVPSNKKLGLALVVAGDVSIEPYMIPFGTIKYMIDTRRAVIQRQGILRSRALLPKWKLTFEVCWESQHLGTDFPQTILPELLERLGGTIGLGDFRPAKRGPFGRFRVVSIK